MLDMYIDAGAIDPVTVTYSNLTVCYKRTTRVVGLDFYYIDLGVPFKEIRPSREGREGDEPLQTHNQG